MATWKKILLDVDNSVSTSNITDLAVTTAKLETSAGTTTGVTSAKIATAAVTTDKIANSAVTLATLTVGVLGTSKIAGPAQTGRQLVGRFSSSTLAPLHALTVGANFNFYEEMIAHPDPQEEDIVGSYSINSRYPTITGTENQITVVAANDNFTLTTPQSIATTSNVSFNSLSTTEGVTVGGNLVVNGSVTSIESTTLTVKDANILLYRNDTLDISASASGSGITIDTGANNGSEGLKMEEYMPMVQWQFSSVNPNVERTGATESGIGWLIRDNAKIYGQATDEARPNWSVVGCQSVASSGVVPGTINKGMLFIVGEAVYIGT